MKKKIKKFLKQFLYNKGYEINYLGKKNLLNINPFLAIKEEIHSNPLVFFDVGVNHGQTLKKIHDQYPNAVIHGFEPSKICYNSVLEKVNNDNIILNNKAVGDQIGILDFNQYSWDALSSVLKREFTSATIVDTYKVDVTTLDVYCSERGVKYINVLKTDTEGFELKVLEGASQLFKDNKIQCVHVELFFEPHFVGQSSAGDIMNFLFKHQFKLVRFYEFDRSHEGYASRTDALFINPNFKE
ncbi:MAG: FkbM family methyltransferase [Flavobacteriaceae bacterium]